VRVIGLMSGTSADAIDAALVEWPDGAEARPFRLVAFRETPHPAALRDRIHALAAGRVAAGEALHELARLDVELGEAFAGAAIALPRRPASRPTRWPPTARPWATSRRTGRPCRSAIPR
jgi:anhydro-N-acetylmuramic acid kinase